MERYRIEPQPQSHYCLANVGSGSAKYQLQQFRPSFSYGVDATQTKFAHERQCGKYDSINDTVGGTGDRATSVSASIYRERERNIEKREAISSDSNERTIIHSCPDHRQPKQQQQQQNKSAQWEQLHVATPHERDQSHSPGGRRYHFGRGGRGRGGGGDAGSASTEDGESYSPYGAFGCSTRAATHDDRATSLSKARTSVRERECVAPEEKPILRSEHKRHSR